MPKGLPGGGELFLQADFSGVIEAMAAGQALAFSVKDKAYLNAIVDFAYGVADEEFNVEAAAYAAATGNISHMYEWGTVGINKGKTNMRPLPQSPRARLWETFAAGSGLDRTLTYIFKPSLAYVPKPTQAATGMDPAVIKKMRDHVFKWKAEAFEEGRTVTVNRKKAKWLLIPAYEQNRPYMRKSDVKRGYTLAKGPITSSPGESHYYGNFTEFWYQFWEGRGGEILDKSITDQMLGDFEPAFMAANASRGVKPLYATSITGQVQKRSKQLLEGATAKAKARALGMKGKKKK